jgi:hypothetical protein
LTHLILNLRMNRILNLINMACNICCWAGPFYPFVGVLLRPKRLAKDHFVRAAAACERPFHSNLSGLRKTVYFGIPHLLIK